MTTDTERRRAWDGYAIARLRSGAMLKDVPAYADSLLAERDKRFPPQPTLTPTTGTDSCDPPQPHFRLCVVVDCRNGAVDGSVFCREHVSLTNDSRPLEPPVPDLREGQGTAASRAAEGEKAAHHHGIHGAFATCLVCAERERLRIAALVEEWANLEQRSAAGVPGAVNALRNFARYLRSEEKP